MRLLTSFITLFPIIFASDPICEKYLESEQNNILSFSNCSQTSTCTRSNRAKRIYVLGPTGVGKSSFNNVMTGHGVNDDDCFRAAHEIKSTGGVTRVVSDEGCFKLLKGTYSSDITSEFDDEVVFIDTPGLGDASKNNKEILHHIKCYHDVEIKQGNKVTAFIIMLNGKDPRFSGQVKSAVEEIYKSFGISFIKHVVFVFNRLPVKTSDERQMRRKIFSRPENVNHTATEILLR